MEKWVTINGNHVYIENGTITKGPKNLIGRSQESINDPKKDLEYKNKIEELATSRGNKSLKEWQDSVEEYAKSKNISSDEVLLDIGDYEDSHLDKFRMSPDVIKDQNAYNKLLNNLSEEQIKAQTRLKINARKGVSADIEQYLKGADFDGNEEDFLNAVSNEWLVDRNEVNDLFNELKDKQNKTNKILNNFKERGVEVLDEVPEGWTERVGATTAPEGYKWYGNNKSLFGGEYKHALVKDNGGIKTKSISYDTMTRKELAGLIADDQIKRGVIKPESKEMIVHATLYGSMKESKQQLLDYAKKWL